VKVGTSPATDLRAFAEYSLKTEEVDFSTVAPMPVKFTVDSSDYKHNQTTCMSYKQDSMAWSPEGCYTDLDALDSWAIECYCNQVGGRYVALVNDMSREQLAYDFPSYGSEPANREATQYLVVAYSAPIVIAFLALSYLTVWLD